MNNRLFLLKSEMVSLPTLTAGFRSVGLRKEHGYRNTHLALSSPVRTTLVGTALCVFPTQVLMRSDDSYNTDIISVPSIP